MLFARLAIGALTTLTAGLVTAVIARGSLLARLMPGALLLVVFIPVHIMLWDKFPVWYHLTFLVSLVPRPTWAGRSPRLGHSCHCRLAAWARRSKDERPEGLQS
jgi:hypothetical protein